MYVPPPPTPHLSSLIAGAQSHPTTMCSTTSVASHMRWRENGQPLISRAITMGMTKRYDEGGDGCHILLVFCPSDRVCRCLFKRGYVKISNCLQYLVLSFVHPCVLELHMLSDQQRVYVISHHEVRRYSCSSLRGALGKACERVKHDCCEAIFIGRLLTVLATRLCRSRFHFSR